MQIVRARKPTLSLDLAPLIDVVFQLLVFFMLTSVFSQPAMKLALPKAASSDQPVQERIVVSISRSGEITINGELSSMATLKEDMATYIKPDPSKPVHIRGDKDMPYHYFVDVMDAARQLGAQTVHIVHQK